MKNKSLKDSFLVNSLFVSKEGKIIADSSIVKIFRFSHCQTSLVLGFLAIIASWYEPILKYILPSSMIDVLPLVLITAALAFANKSSLRLYKLHYWYVAFLFVSLVSSFFAVAGGVAGLNAPLYMLILIQFFMALLWAQAQRLRDLLRGLLLVSLPLALYGVWQSLSGNVLYSTSSLEALFGRASAFFSSPNVFGMLMVIMVIVALFIARSEGYLKYLPVLLIFALAAAMSLSRTAWLAGLIGLIPLLTFRPTRNELSGMALLPGLQSRLGVIFKPEYWQNAAIDGRLWSINNGIYIVKNSPFIGTGAGTYGGKFAEIYTSPVYFLGMQNGYVPLRTTDNQYIAFLVQFGILGLMSFLGFVLSLWFQSFFTAGSQGKLMRAVLLSFSSAMYYAPKSTGLFLHGFSLSAS